MMQRHQVTTDPPGRFGPRSRLYCHTCQAVEFTDRKGDDLQRFAYTDTSWHRAL